MKDLKELNLKDKKYIIFDMDGTLIDSIGVWNITDQKLIEKYGNKKISLEKIQTERDKFLHNNQDTDIYLAYCGYLIKKYKLNVDSASSLLNVRWNISGEVLEKEMDYKKDVVNLILRLKKLGFILILATMTTQVQLDIYTKKNKKMLDKMNIDEVFDLITKKEDVKNKKPNPEIYNKIREHYNASKEECLIFEDSYTGVLAAKAAGIEVVNIYDKYAEVDREKIDKITDYKINNYKELLNLAIFDREIARAEEIKAITIAENEDYLRTISKTVELDDPLLTEDIKVLEEYCKTHKVMAMAAIQLGIPKRIIYLKNTNLELINKSQQNILTAEEEKYNEARILINPIIISREGLTDYWEACASCLDNFGHVRRPYKILVEYQDIKGEKHSEEFSGFESTVLSHEMDHLDGILHMDIADELLQKTKEERNVFRQKHNYNIVSKTGDYEKLLETVKPILVTKQKIKIKRA